MEPLHVGVALDGAGWHPAAWREPGARPQELLTAQYWLDLVREAERGLLDLVTFEDAFTIQNDRTDQVAGRLDALLIAARVGPLTSNIGLIPTVVATHTEPFHLSKAIATLDYVSGGRAGVRIKVSRDPVESALFGRRDVEGVGLEELFGEARDYVEVVRRLWDSWEDDAEIRDAATGRFVDREKLHRVDFEGPHFAVRGPSITPRPPQGQPLVSALAHRDEPYRFVGTSADLGFVTPHATSDIGPILEQIRAAQEERTVHVLGDVLVVLDDDENAARERLTRLNERAPLESDALVVAGTPAQLADLVLDWHAAGLSGVRLRPAVLPDDLEQITRGLVPELQRRGAFRSSYEAGSQRLGRSAEPAAEGASTTLRGLFGLPRPANRYAGV